MLTFALGAVAGVIAAVVSPPLFRFASAKVLEFEAWRATRRGPP
jgi:hypothetical protein